MFLFSKLVGTLLMPLGMSFIFYVVGFIFFCKNYKKLFLLTIMSATTYLYIPSIPYFSHWLAKQIEVEPKTLDEIDVSEAIVVLGGAVAQRKNSDLIFINERFERIRYAAQLFHSGKAPLVLVTGGSMEGNVAEAEVIKKLLIELNVPADVVMTEVESRNTVQNGIYSKKILDTMNIKDVILVTSAFHMKRSVKIFESNGINVQAAPTDYLDIEQAFQFQKFIPNSDALQQSSLLIKEMIGILVI